MTSGIAPPVSRPSEPQPDRQAAECQGYIDKRLRQTRRQVKSVDLWAFAITLAAGALAYLLAAVLADYWLISGGLGFGGRLIVFAGLLGGVSLYVAVGVVPLLTGRVNPIFAAHSIEQSRPSLKNSLINLLYLRRERSVVDQDELSRGIYQALERKTATDLTQIPVDIAVDRSRLVRLGYLLAAILAVCCLYLVLWPKSTMASFRRVIWPWADVNAPTRVTIEGVEPGDAVGYQGDIVSVSAGVEGLADDEAVLLYYTTADGRSVDQAIPMRRPEGRSRHECDLPPGRFGLQQDVEYYLTAGDCRTPRFKLEVQTALSIVVDRVEYDYPEYTGIPDRIDQRLADLKAIEAARVTIRATANQEIDRAALEMDCDPRHALKMTVEQSRGASARITLRMDPNDLSRPEHESYQLRFTDRSGRQNRRPIRHRIEVIGDLPPEVSFIDPPPEEIELPEDGVLELRIRAEDPDFAIRRVALRAEIDEQSLPVPPLLDKPRPEAPHEGPFQETYLFEPARLKLKAGDRVIYWAEAEDNMHWEEQGGSAPAAGGTKIARPPNRSETARRWITITSPEGRRPPEQPSEEPRPSSEQGPEEKQGQTPEPPEETQQEREGEPGEEQEQATPADQQPGQGEQSQQDGSDQQEQKPSDQKQPGQESGDQQSGPSAEGSQPQQPGQSPAQEGSGQQATGQEKDGQEGETSQSEAGGEGSPSGKPGQGSGEQSGAHSGGQPSASREPIDGQTNPGDAFDEILNHRAENQQNQAPSGQEGGPETPGGQGADQPDAGEAAQGAEGEEPSGDEPAAGDRRQTSSRGQPPGDRQQSAPQGPPEPSRADQPDQQRTPDNHPADDQQADTSQQPEDGQGAQAKGPGEPTQEESSGKGQENPDARGGDPEDSKGQGGAGKPSSENAGSPSPQEANQQRKKQPGEGDQSEPSEGQSAQSPTTSPKDSDSQGDTSGDRSGGGEQGGGQRAKQPGTGAAGTNTASEQGGSQSDQQGEGETGTEAGGQVEADRPTGRPAEEGKGPGSGRNKQPGSERPGQKPQDQQETSASGGPSHSDQPGDPKSSEHDADAQGAPAAGHPGSGGQPDQQQVEPPSPEPGTYHPEDANLDYARKATNLALEYLEDQLSQDQPDPELLRRLGWTKDDLKRFYQQWDQMRREASGQGAGAKSAREGLDRALESLGLRPRGTETRGGRTKSDQLHNLKEDLRIDPPPEWTDAFRAYTTGVGGGND